MKSQDAKDYIVKVLTDANLRGVEAYPTGNVHAQCPYHLPKRNTTAFGISFVKSEEGYPFSCRSCGEKGSLASLLMKLHGINRKKALRRIVRRISTPRITMESLEEGLHLVDDEQYIEQLVSERTSALPPKAGDQQPMVDYMFQRKYDAHKVMMVDWLIREYELYYCDSGRMHHRIIAPIYDDTGAIITYNDRTILPHEKRKSLHKPEQSILDVFNGLQQALGKKAAVIVEGMFDMFQVRCALKRAGKKYFNKYGVLDNMGVGSSEGKAAVLIENFDEVILLFDNQYNDKGKNEGLDGSWKFWKLLKSVIPVKVATSNLKLGNDPGICTTEQIIRALELPGWEPPTMLSEMEDLMSM